jgi:hypothetical protein
VRPGEFRILAPLDGATVNTETVSFVGVAPVGATVVRNIGFAPDESVVATDGTWSLTVKLGEGNNSLTFRLGDDEATATTIDITYAPSTALVTPVPTAEPTPEPTAEPTPEPTAEPTPVPTPRLTYAKLSSRAWAKLVKAPDNYIGKGYQIWACISQFDAATGLDSFRGQASYHKLTYWYTDGANTIFTGDESRLSDFVQDDVVVMNVIGAGSYSYDTQAGGNTTVPAFLISKITRKGSCK